MMHCSHSLMHSFHKRFLSTYYVLGTALGTGDITVRAEPITVLSSVAPELFFRPSHTTALTSSPRNWFVFLFLLWEQPCTGFSLCADLSLFSTKRRIPEQGAVPQPQPKTSVFALLSTPSSRNTSLRAVPLAKGSSPAPNMGLWQGQPVPVVYPLASVVGRGTST